MGTERKFIFFNTVVQHGVEKNYRQSWKTSRDFFLWVGEKSSRGYFLPLVLPQWPDGVEKTVLGKNDPKALWNVGTVCVPLGRKSRRKFFQLPRSLEEKLSTLQFVNSIIISKF